MTPLPAVLANWRYCPRCGGAMHQVGQEVALVCGLCSHRQYPFQYLSVCLLLEARGALLVVDRLNEPRRGTLDLPGGFANGMQEDENGVLLDLPEDPEDTARRELLEETGIKLDAPLQVVAVIPDYYGTPATPTYTTFYHATLAEQVPVQGADDAGNPRWVAVDQITPEDFGFPCLRKVFARFQQMRSNGQI